MFRSSRTAVFAGCFAASLLACAESGVDPSSLDPADFATAGQGIVNGHAPDEVFHDAVVALSIVKGGSGYICSGTVIAPRVVLTAAHCLDGANGGPSFRPVAPSAVEVRTGDSFYAPTASFAVTELLIHPSYDRRRLTNDIAILRTASDVPVAPVPALPSSLGFTSADVGLALNFAGFGRTETGGLGIKLQADNTLAGLGCVVPGCPSGAPAATQFSYDQSAAPCSGDSGGPAFVFRGSTVYVGGVTSYGDANCTVYGVSTRVDAYQSWITSFVGSAPFCGDGVCSGGESCSSCAGDCGACPYCGDGVCNGGESCSSCAGDCGACPYCGDGVCNGDETCSSCTGDCGACPYCGDGVCDPSESCSSCAGDCGACPSCGLLGEVCSSDADCCFGKCRGRSGAQTCR